MRTPIDVTAAYADPIPAAALDRALKPPLSMSARGALPARP